MRFMPRGRTQPIRIKSFLAHQGLMKSAPQRDGEALFAAAILLYQPNVRCAKKRLSRWPFGIQFSTECGRSSGCHPWATLLPCYLAARSYEEQRAYHLDK